MICSISAICARQGNFSWAESVHNLRTQELQDIVQPKANPDQWAAVAAKTFTGQNSACFNINTYVSAIIPVLSLYL